MTEPLTAAQPVGEVSNLKGPLRHHWIVLAGITCSVLGYWAADRWESSRVWRGDESIKNTRVQGTASSAREPSSAATASVRFVDFAMELGIDFAYFNGAEGNFHLMETTGGGMAVLDFDGDGNPDIFFVNGCRLPVSPRDRRSDSKLYRNHVAAEDVTVAAGLEFTCFGQGAAVGDLDNDGFPDLCVTGYGRCTLYRNLGDGTFCDISESAGIQSDLWSTSAAFADLDQDGALDFYVCTYGDVRVDQPRLCRYGDRRVYCLPSVYSAQPDLLFRNLGDGSFREVSQSSGIRDSNGRGLGIAIADFNGDGVPDVFVANDTSENFLWLNRHGFQFTESALTSGVALTGTGATMSGMGVACADYDRNGWIDLCVTNFYQLRSALYRNMGDRGFIDSADATGIGAASRDRLGFGTMFLDANLDGYPDLFVANGHINDSTQVGIPYRMRQQVMLNQRGERFLDVSESAGPYFTRHLLGRGTATLDYDNDGRPDVAVSHLFDPAALLLNRTTDHGHWLGLQFIGTRSNRDATNSVILISIANETRVEQLVAGCGYLSSSDKRLLVGLGTSQEVSNVTVRWPSGSEQPIGPIAADKYSIIRERF